MKWKPGQTGSDMEDRRGMGTRLGGGRGLGVGGVVVLAILSIVFRHDFLSPAGGSNQVQVRMELQADCLAGI